MVISRMLMKVVFDLHLFVHKVVKICHLSVVKFAYGTILKNFKT